MYLNLNMKLFLRIFKYSTSDTTLSSFKLDRACTFKATLTDGTFIIIIIFKYSIIDL